MYLDLRAAHHLRPEEIERITVDIFDVAYHIIGGGEEGNKQQVRTKEEADHSLPYLLAVALLDGEVTPAQYVPERIQRADVQTLLRQITVQPDSQFSQRFPAEMPCRIQVWLRNGRTLHIEKADYGGFVTRPMSWEQVVGKFERLAAPFTSPTLRQAMIETIATLEARSVAELTRQLASVGKEQPR